MAMDKRRIVASLDGAVPMEIVDFSSINANRLFRRDFAQTERSLRARFPQYASADAYRFVIKRLPLTRRRFDYIGQLIWNGRNAAAAGA